MVIVKVVLSLSLIASIGTAYALGNGKNPVNVEKRNGHFVRGIELQEEKDQHVLGPIKITKLDNPNPDIMSFHINPKNKADVEKVEFAIRADNNDAVVLSGAASLNDSAGGVRADFNVSTLASSTYVVKLTISLDKNGPQKTFVAMVRFERKASVYYDGDLEPSDPGPAGDLTVIGVDADGDGVRDDVERWINSKGLLSNQRAALIAFAKKLQSRTLVSQDRDASNILTRQILNYDYCMRLQFNPEMLKEFTAGVQIEQYGTRERLIEWARTQGHFGGQEVIAEVDESKYSQYCF